MGDAGTILVVEDDDSIRLLLRETLKASGYTPFEAGDGFEAIGAARDCNPDLILLDIGLPGQDGFAVLAKLKADPELERIPVIMVTAWAEPDLVRRALDRGAHDYVRKPFALDELGARVDAAMRLSARHAELAADNERLSEMARIDPLTSLPNRRAIEGDLERMVATADRSGRPFTAMMIDVDAFNDVNDTHGHGVGDALLAAVARRLSKHLRASDVLGRWGGDELLVLAPETDDKGAAGLAERLRAAVGERPVDTASAAVRASVSIGYLAWCGETAEEVLERVDTALFAAKAAGRDQAVAAEPRHPLPAAA